LNALAGALAFVGFGLLAVSLVVVIGWLGARPEDSQSGPSSEVAKVAAFLGLAGLTLLAAAGKMAGVW
jgi:hypothetical protein